MPSRIRRTALLLGIVLAAGTVAGVALRRARGESDLLRALSRETRGHGLVGVRLSVLSSFRACPTEAAAHCGVFRPSRRAISLIGRAEDAARGGTDPRALQAAALGSLLYSSHAQILLDRSISYLQSAARMAQRPAPVLADLAAALLVRAERTQTAHDLFKALDAAQQALEQEPENLAARFNAAVALDRIGLRREAAAAWGRYLAADSGSGWATFARTRRQALSAAPRAITPPSDAGGIGEMAAYAAAAPQAARELGWDTLLGEWGGAVLTGNGTAARLRLDQAGALGSTLITRGWDASLADAVEEIRRRAGSRGGTLRLARQHRMLADARREQLAANHESACPMFRRVQREADSPALREWGATFVGLCSAYVPEPDFTALEALAAEADTARHPAIASRRSWILGYALQKAGRYDQAVAAYARAGDLAKRAGDHETAAQMLMQIGNAHSEVGDANSGYASLHAALAVLRNRPGSLGLYNLLFALRNVSLADGLSRAAILIQDEAVAAAAEMRQPFYLAETLLARARLQLAAGRPHIDGDVRAAMKIMDAMSETYLRGALGADLHETRARALLAPDPERAAAELDAAVGYFTDPARLVPALFARAEAHLALGRNDLAEADLRRAVDVMDLQRMYVSSAQLRGSLLEQSRRVFDRAVMLNVRAGRAARALDYVERSRASFSLGERGAEWAGRPLRAPAGQVAVELALVGDTLLAWTLWTGGMRLTHGIIDREELVRTVEQVRSALELRSSGEAVRPALEMLYDQLIRPIRADLGPPGTPLVIVADGELSTVPMAALRDRERGRYLVQDHPVRFASSLRDPSVPAVPPAPATRVTLIADPAFAPDAFPQLERLAEAKEEVRALAGRYPAPRVLLGEHAHAGALRAAFGGGGIVHFAGHAVFDDARPEHSYLVAAPGSAGLNARLTASEVERMDLGGLRLVVLSACQTSRSTAGRSGGFAGLAGAFLAAGAGGVVGSLWRADDGYTRVLMEHFHRGYQETGDAARALRQAQLAMLRSRNPELRSPAAWAGFRYTGS